MLLVRVLEFVPSWEESFFVVRTLGTGSGIWTDKKRFLEILGTGHTMSLKVWKRYISAEVRKKDRCPMRHRYHPSDFADL